MSGLLSGLRNIAIPAASSRGVPRAAEIPAPPSTPQESALPQPPQEYRPGAVAGMLNAADVHPQERRPDVGFSHVSDLIGKCHRRVALESKYPCPPSGGVSKGQRVIWTLGRAAEGHCVSMLQEFYGDRLFGIFVCACGRSDFVGTGEAAAAVPACHKCGTRLRNYRGLTLTCGKSGVIGNADIAVAFGKSIVIVETKSVGKSGLSELERSNRPEHDHAVQALTYRRMLSDAVSVDLVYTSSGWSVAPVAVVLYVMKDFQWGKSPYLEFSVSESPEYLPALRLLESGGRKIKAFRENKGPLPDQLPCCASAVSASDNSTCRECPVSSVCFSMRSGPPAETTPQRRRRDARRSY